MKSLLITFDYPPIVSGIGTFFFNVWKHMNSESYIILAPKTNRYEEVDAESRCEVIRYPRFFAAPLLRLGGLLAYCLYLINKRKIDILVCGAPYTFGLIGLIIKKLLKKPYCVFYYGGEYGKFRNKKPLFYLLKLVLVNADAIVVNSEYTLTEVKKFPVSEEKITKVTPGVDIDMFHPGLECSRVKKDFGIENKKMLLTVSRLAKRKGIDTVIKALPGIKKRFPEVVYLVVGEGKEKDYLQTLTKENNTKENVIFAGYVKDEDLPLFYNACEVYVMPNRQTYDWDVMEGFGISFIEAAACGKPAIGGIVGGAADAIEDGETGLLVDAGDIKDVIRCVVYLLENQSRAEEFGRSGRRRAEAAFQWKDRACIVQNILGKITENNNS